MFTRSSTIIYFLHFALIFREFDKNIIEKHKKRKNRLQGNSEKINLPLMYAQQPQAHVTSSRIEINDHVNFISKRIKMLNKSKSAPLYCMTPRDLVSGHR